MTAAAPTTPQTLYEQLVDGGRMALPVGNDDQVLEVVTKADPPDVQVRFEVRFGPMLGDPR